MPKEGTETIKQLMDFRRKLIEKHARISNCTHE
jgi:hypothetical protein